MANKTDSKAAEPLHIYGADWIEADAIKAGYFFVDMFGVKHGTRPTSPDPALLNNPVEQAQIDAETAVMVAVEKTTAIAAKLIEAERADPGQPAMDTRTGGFFYFNQKQQASEAVRNDLKAELKEAQDAEQRARIKLSRIEAARRERIFQWNLKQVQETPLQSAIAETQRIDGSKYGRELSEKDARELAKQSS